MSHSPNAERFNQKRDMSMHSARQEVDEDTADHDDQLLDGTQHQEREQPVYGEQP